MNTEQLAEAIANETDLEMDEAIEQWTSILSQAIQNAKWAQGRQLEYTYDDFEGLQVYQILQVVEQVDPKKTFLEVNMKQAEVIDGPGAFALGDEILVLISFDPKTRKVHDSLTSLPLPTDVELEEKLQIPDDCPLWIQRIWPWSL